MRARHVPGWRAQTTPPATPGAEPERHGADQQREVGAEAATDLRRDLPVATEVEVHEGGDQEVPELDEQRPGVAERLGIEAVQGEERERADGDGEQHRGEHAAQGEDGERVGHPSGRQGSVQAMRVTVTGGAGYIGATATRELLSVLVLGSDPASRVFNVGHSDENYRKLDLVELIRERLPEADVRFVHRDEDPRDYRVSFERIRSELGFDPVMRVPDGVAEVLVALEERRFGDPFDGRFSNV